MIDIYRALSADASYVYSLSNGTVPRFKVARLLLADPGFQVLSLYRIMHVFRDYWFGKKVNKLLRLISVHVFSCDISSDASIGCPVYLPHPIGIVVGKGVIIGEETIIYQNVTIGLRSPTSQGYPIIGPKTVIGAGACVVGPVKTNTGQLIEANSVVA